MSFGFQRSGYVICSRIVLFLDLLYHTFKVLTRCCINAQNQSEVDEYPINVSTLLHLFIEYLHDTLLNCCDITKEDVILKLNNYDSGSTFRRVV